MFEIVLLIVAAGGIAAYARGRGGNPIVWGGLGVGGYAFLNYIVPVILLYLHRPLDPNSRMWLFMVAAAWVASWPFVRASSWEAHEKSHPACGPAQTASTSISSTP